MKVDRLGSFFWLTVGLISTYGSYLLGLGNLEEPGAGLFPFFAGCFISLMAMITFLQTFLRDKKTHDKLSTLWEGVNYYRPLSVCLLSLGYLLVLERIGFLLSGFLLLFILFKGVERLSWRKSISYPAITVGIVFLLIKYLLKGSLPTGIFGF